MTFKSSRWDFISFLRCRKLVSGRRYEESGARIPGSRSLHCRHQSLRIVAVSEVCIQTELCIALG